MTTLLPFCPKAVFGATKESDLLGLLCFGNGFSVHIAQHQYAFGICILHDGGNKSVWVFAKIDFHRIGILCNRNSFFSSGMLISLK